MSTATASQRTHQPAIGGCQDAIYVRAQRATLIIDIIGGHTGKPTKTGMMPVVSGHVELLALDSPIRNPGVFDCI
jgi:hypothetical protein